MGTWRFVFIAKNIYFLKANHYSHVSSINIRPSLGTVPSKGLGHFCLGHDIHLIGIERVSWPCGWNTCSSTQPATWLIYRIHWNRKQEVRKGASCNLEPWLASPRLCVDLIQLTFHVSISMLSIDSRGYMPSAPMTVEVTCLISFNNQQQSWRTVF